MIVLARAGGPGRFAGDLALLACAVGWGTTFPITRAALEESSPLALNAARFLLATVFLIGGAFRPDTKALRRALVPGLVLGCMLALGYGLQTWSLTLIGPSRSAFLTSFYVLFTPFLDWIWNREPPRAITLTGAVIAVAGVGVMSGGFSGSSFGLGDALTLLCALLFAAQIVGLGSALRTCAVGPLLFLQIGATGVLSAFASPMFETPRLSASPWLWLQIAFLSLVATNLLLAFQAYGQRRTTATRAAVLFASEPMWAAIFAAIAGERLARSEWLGAGLVLAGILVATLPRVRSTPRDPGDMLPRVATSDGAEDTGDGGLQKAQSKCGRTGDDPSRGGSR